MSPFWGDRGKAVGVPVIWHLRDILKPGLTWMSLRGVLTFFGVKVVIANSEATQKAFGSRKQVVIYNGLDESLARRTSRKIFHEQFNLPPSTQVVGIVGVLAPWKGQELFIEMASAFQSRSDVVFVVVGEAIYDTSGDRGYTEKLKNQVKALRLGRKVLFAGYRDQPFDVMSGLDILVHASLKPEPFGRVVLEALACGTPVVAAAAGGILEIVEDQVSGLLYPPGDREKLTACVDRYLKDSSFRALISERSRTRFLSKFSLATHVDAVSAQLERFKARS